MESKKTVKTDEPVCRAAMETERWKKDLWTWAVGRRKERVGQMGRVAWKRNYHMQNREPLGTGYRTQGTQTGAL